MLKYFKLQYHVLYNFLSDILAKTVYTDRGDKANVGKVNSEYRYLSLSCNLSLGLKFFIKLGEVINTQADR